MPEATDAPSLKLGAEYRLRCRVDLSGDKAKVVVHRDDQMLFSWSGEASQVTGPTILHPQTIGFTAPPGTTCLYRGLRLRMLSGQARPIP